MTGAAAFCQAEKTHIRLRLYSSTSSGLVTEGRMSNRGLCLAVLLTVACAQTRAALAAYAGDDNQAFNCLGSAACWSPALACGASSPPAQEVISASAFDTIALSTVNCDCLAACRAPTELGSWATVRDRLPHRGERAHPAQLCRD